MTPHSRPPSRSTAPSRTESLLAELRELVAVSAAEADRYRDALERAALVIEAALAEIAPAHQAAPQERRMRAGERGLQSIGIEADDVGRDAAATSREEGEVGGGQTLDEGDPMDQGARDDDTRDDDTRDDDTLEDDTLAAPEPGQLPVPEMATDFAEEGERDQAEPTGGES